MPFTDAQLAVAGADGGGSWGTAFGVVGALVVVNMLVAVAKWRERRKVPAEQLVEELRRAIRTGVPNVRGHIRVTPSDYPGISDAQAEGIAQEEGFLRQTHGTKGLWLFYRMGTQPGSTMDTDMRGGPPVEELRQSAAARRAADWIRERDGFDLLDEDTVEEAEKGMRKARARNERCFVGGFFCALAGVPILIAVVMAWVDGAFSVVGGAGDVSFMVVAHLLAVALLPWAVFLFKKSRRALREGRDRYGPVLAAYGEVVVAREIERRAQ